ncbi:unnamed protein product [Ranitomeya imitator]|uniref:C-type lectin domain-containing protein n=1 Tax=Ranitomeya imitator TaxID=111125 RepID=A0ABN9M6G5_9NEOB|nr:unnamed protein product [Ranitomeya imitator]
MCGDGASCGNVCGTQPRVVMCGDAASCGPISCHLDNEVGEHRSITPAPEITETKIDKSAPCDDDWIWYRGKCYYFSTARDTWGNSEKFCHSHNSSLAIIESKEELDFLFRHKDLDHHWIGMRRTDDNTAWTWTDGTSYNESLSKERHKRTIDPCFSAILEMWEGAVAQISRYAVVLTSAADTMSRLESHCVPKHWRSATSDPILETGPPKELI